MHNWDDDRIYQRACLGLAREGLKVYLVAMKSNLEPSKSTVEFSWVKPRSGWKRRWYSSKDSLKEAIKVNANIYHFHDPDLLPHVLKIKKRLPNSKVIYDIHENYAGRFQNWGLPSFFGKLFRLYENYIINRIDGYTVVSESMNKLFKNKNTPSLIIRNTTDISRLNGIDFPSIKKSKKRTIYTSGTNSHARNCLQTVRALKYLDQYLSFQMVFVGKYQNGLKEEIRQQVKKDNTENFLFLEDMLPWEDNFKRTAKAFLGCVFYEDNPNNRVGIPNRLFEYMFCGLPVVASNFIELKNIIDDAKCGILVDSNNPKSIAKAFSYLLNNPNEAEKMGKRGKKAIEIKYGYHIDLKNTINFYNELLK